MQSEEENWAGKLYPGTLVGEDGKEPEDYLEIEERSSKFANDICRDMCPANFAYGYDLDYSNSQAVRISFVFCPARDLLDRKVEP